MGCASCLAAAHGDPLAERAALACCHGSIGDATSEADCGKAFLPPVTFLWPSDVRDKKTELDAQWQATDVAMHACAAMPAVQFAGWAKDFASWQAFAAEDVPWFGAATKMEAAFRFQCKLRGWQDVLGATSCVLPGPKVPIPSPTSTLDDTMSTVKTVAIGGAVIAGVVLVAPIVWEFVGSKVLASGRKKR